MDLTLTQQQLPGVTVIGVRGELDLLTCEQLEERLAQVRRPGDFPSLRRAIGAAFNEQVPPGVQAHGS